MHEERNGTTDSTLGHTKGERLAVLAYSDPGSPDHIGFRVRTGTHVLRLRRSLYVRFGGPIQK